MLDGKGGRGGGGGLDFGRVSVVRLSGFDTVRFGFFREVTLGEFRIAADGESTSS